jgi:glycosyltransferase involved in cell wall biosynthesis
MTWHLVTGEYPPGCGGVGDYTALLARALGDAGEEVVVWVPGDADEPGNSPESVRRLPDRFGSRSREVLARAWQQQPGVVLLQYVPNALGVKGANLSFCRWLRGMRQRDIDVRVMFHEPYFYFSMERPWRNALAVVQRMMAAELIKASRCVYVSSETWRDRLEPYGRLKQLITLPIPSTIPDTADAGRTRDLRRLAAGDSLAPLVGHFGTYGDHMAAMIDATVPVIAERLPHVRFALLGDRSLEFLNRLIVRFPVLRDRVWASGRLAAPDVSAALRACDLLFQPYPDGVTTRRTSVMAGLANAVPVVTTDGALTEQVWRETKAALLISPTEASEAVDAVHRLLASADDRVALGRRGQQVYTARFSIERTVDAVRASRPLEVAAG